MILFFSLLQVGQGRKEIMGMTDLPRVEAHCQMDQPEEGVANGLWCCLHEAQVSHLEVPEGLAPALRQPAGRVLWGPLVCMLLTECHLDISPQGYQLLHCKQTHACHQDLRLHCKVSKQLAFSGRSCARISCALQALLQCMA